MRFIIDLVITATKKSRIGCVKGIIARTFLKTAMTENLQLIQKAMAVR